jgi:hypothetical protein
MNEESVTVRKTDRSVEEASFGTGITIGIVVGLVIGVGTTSLAACIKEKSKKGERKEFTDISKTH